MIRTFRDDATRLAFEGKPTKGFPADLRKPALRKLIQLNEAEVIDALRVPPGNRLEALKGGRSGQYSIRINDQWRICFEWREGNAWHVEITDYH
jgi:proteic killer suppression protein